MLKDTPKGLLEAVIAIHTQSRADYIKEQQTRMSGKEGPADPPAHQSAKKMANWPSHLTRSSSAAAPTAEPRGGAGIKKGRAYGGGMQKEAAEGSMPRSEREKKLAAMTPPRNKITHGDVLHGRGVRKEEIEQIDELSQEKMTSYMKAAKKDIYKNLRGGEPQPGSKRAAKVEKRVTGYRKAWAKVSEEKDTPGNGYSHQCAIHVKSEQYGEGRTLTSQHAEPDADGNIAWYDVMFDEGIKRVFTDDLEILVSESHMNHKKKKSM